MSEDDESSEYNLDDDLKDLENDTEYLLERLIEEGYYFGSSFKLGEDYIIKSYKVSTFSMIDSSDKNYYKNVFYFLDNTGLKDIFIKNTTEQGFDFTGVCYNDYIFTIYMDVIEYTEDEDIYGNNNSLNFFIDKFDNICIVYNCYGSLNVENQLKTCKKLMETLEIKVIIEIIAVHDAIKYNYKWEDGCRPFFCDKYPNGFYVVLRVPRNYVTKSSSKSANKRNH